MRIEANPSMVQEKVIDSGKFLYEHKAIAGIVFLYALAFLYNLNGNSGFFSSYSQTLILIKATVNIIVACGVTFAVMTRSIDLSIGGVLALSGVLVIKFMNIMPVWLAILLTVLIGVIVGFINGFLIVHQNLEGFIVTLGMGILLKGVALQLTDAHPISARLSFNELADGRQLVFGLARIPNMVIIMLVIVVISSLILRYTQFGRNVYAIGGNYSVAKYSGIPVVRQKWICFGISAGLTAIAGIVNSSHLGAGNANYGDMTAMIVNCAVVVGGTSMAGGIGGVWQSAIGVLFFAVMEFSLNIMVRNSYVIMLIQGMVIVLILFGDSFGNKKRRERV
ncbi:ABC transporter permease [Parasphaerochaeta coccoides]|uniref:Inner-membrane translocator n=1 Tax=Parasphaerochaeta coccoides (strain ATCC BAA-1237 / DSM 17374 / SPN1) TaxID=760011 RepID=F4GJ47_PARC1|nr:ABC transporter permease [Parasphaerochaeta coccoides]AEC01342.1 inner-membrane translocator [Parasphaerochaeta coccoides DSM 17374]